MEKIVDKVGIFYNVEIYNKKDEGYLDKDKLKVYPIDGENFRVYSHKEMWLDETYLEVHIEED